jgi:hypothetical protein
VLSYSRTRERTQNWNCKLCEAGSQQETTSYNSWIEVPTLFYRRHSITVRTITPFIKYVRQKQLFSRTQHSIAIPFVDRCHASKLSPDLYDSYDSSVCIVTGYGLHYRRIGVWFLAASGQDFWPSQFPIKFESGVLSPEVKRPGLESDHSLLPSTTVRNAWAYISAS